MRERVREALLVLPNYFKSSTIIEGIAATDIFTLNTALGATIENQVVASLNAMRPVWDPDGNYMLYSFVRQAQTFPDVLLKRTGSVGNADILLGIELKGWYLLSKEGEPSLRFSVTSAACAPADFVCVVPWSLTNVLSGSPQVCAPWIESAHYTASFRNHHWQHVRAVRNNASTDIRITQGVTPYPVKSDQIADVPVSDGGNNFGRIARTGIMNDYLAATLATPLAGIAAAHWLAFFSIFKDDSLPAAIETAIGRMRDRLPPAEGEPSPVEMILDQCERLLAGD
ncbi:hypothetical protein [Luteolibacter sp. Populi]|uniref:hypothetical protein n=1 Tax=Luteolibacter sp. Populi TaxID=3230487 RepID=UPI003465D260